MSQDNHTARRNRLQQLAQPFHERNFRLFWIGQAVSSLGNAFQGVALPWLVFGHKGATALDLALVLLAQAIPQALGTLWGGVLVDRMESRSVLLWADSMRLMSSSALVALALAGNNQLWLLCGILLVHGLANGCFAPAAASVPPRLVPPSQLESANTLIHGIGQFGPLVATLPAGLLIAAAGPVPAFACNAATYLVALLATLWMHPLARSPHKRTSVLADFREGLRYVRTLPWLMALLGMDIFLALAAIATNSVGLPLLAKQHQVGAQGYSLLVWSYGVGAVGGLLVPSFFTVRGHRGFLCVCIQAMEAALMVMIGFAPLPLAACCVFGWSMLNGIVIIITTTLIQRQVTPDMLGRTLACWTWASTGTLPIALFGGGLVAQAIGPHLLFVVGGLIVLLGSILGLCVPALRHLN